MDGSIHSLQSIAHQTMPNKDAKGKFTKAAPAPAVEPPLEPKMETKEETRRLTVEIPAALHKALRIRAATDDISLTDLVILTIKKGLG